MTPEDQLNHRLLEALGWSPPNSLKRRAFIQKNVANWSDIPLGDGLKDYWLAPEGHALKVPPFLIDDRCLDDLFWLVRRQAPDRGWQLVYDGTGFVLRVDGCPHLYPAVNTAAEAVARWLIQSAKSH